MSSILLPLATTAYSSIISHIKSKRVDSLETNKEIITNTNQEFGFLQKLSLTIATLKAYSNPCLVEKVDARNFNSREKIYLICLVIVLPIDFIRKYGYRKLSTKEKRGIICYWKDFALKNFDVEIDENLSNLKKYIQEFESENQGSHPHACHLVKQAAEIFIDSLPSVLRNHTRGLVRRMIFSLLEDETCQVLGIIPSNWLYKILTDCILLGTGMISGFLVPPSRLKDSESTPVPLLLCSNPINTLLSQKKHVTFPRIKRIPRKRSLQIT